MVTFTVFDSLFLEMQSLSQTQSGKYGSFGEDLLCAGQSYWVHREVKVAKIHLGCIRCPGKSVLWTPVVLKKYFKRKWGTSILFWSDNSMHPKKVPCAAVIFPDWHLAIWIFFVFGYK